jgi:hypothetical protein
LVVLTGEVIEVRRPTVGALEVKTRNPEADATTIDSDQLTGSSTEVLKSWTRHALEDIRHHMGDNERNLYDEGI